MAVLIAHVSDVHAGSSVAVCPPSVSLDDGGEYRASKAQLWLWECWQEFWEEVASERDRLQASLVTVFNGDLVEGSHHATTQILSGNPNAQAAVLDACMGIPLGLGPDSIAIVRGTEVHVGQSASAEERIASGLWKDGRPIERCPDTDTASWWHFRAELEGVLVDVAHHGRTGQREHTRASQAVLYAHDILLSHIKTGDQPPNLCLRGHHHKFNDSHDACPVRVVTSGAFQLSTGYVHRVATDSISDIGGLIVVIRDGQYEVRKVHFKPARGAVWRPASA